MSNFDPNQYMMDLKGKQYLPVAARIAWFRADNPTGAINTAIYAVGDYIIAQASIVHPEGMIIATGSATVRPYSPDKSSMRDIEKAETAAIGRALAHAGYGTMQAGDDVDESDHLADAPVERNHTTQSNEPKKNLTGWFVNNFGYSAFYKAIGPLYENTYERDNSLVGMANRSELHPTMTVDEAIAAVKAYRAAKA